MLKVLPLAFKYDGLKGPSEFMPDNKELYRAINTAAIHYSYEGIASTRVDLVCHNIGGLMARKFILDNDAQKNSFLGYQKGLIRRVITVATPHKGSNWANYFVDEEPNTLYMRDGKLHFASIFLSKIGHG